MSSSGTTTDEGVSCRSFVQWGKYPFTTDDSHYRYKGCFERIFIWSPSVFLDDTWSPVREYIEKELHPDKDEKYMFDSYDPDDLERILETQRKIIEYMKSKKMKK